MLITPSFDEVQDEVTPGTYKVRVVAAKVDKWESDKGVTPYINWQMETFGESDPKNNGRKIFHKTATAGKGAFQLQRFYRAATGSTLAGAFNTEQLYGKQLKVEIVDGVNRQTGQPTGYTEVKSVAAAT